MSCTTIREILIDAEKEFGKEDAIRFKLKKDEIGAKTYTQLKNDSESFSRVLLSLGEQGSHIAITGMTSYEWIVSYLGTVNSESVAVPLDVSLPADELCELINRADVTVLVFDEIRNDVASLAMEKCPKLKHIISMQKETGDDKIQSFRELIKENEGSFDQMPKPDSLCTIMFTSGTTGKSKGVMLTHQNMAENATCLDMKLPPRNVILSVLPIHHAYCLSMDILKGISLGSVICINDSLMRVAKNIKLFKPNMILMVPLMIETIAKKLEEAKLLPAKIVKKKVFGDQFNTICSGGAYLNPALIDLFERYGITILQGYGMTECSPVISTNLPWKIKRDSVGKLMPNCEAKVVDGELWVKGSSVMQGYYNMPDETAQALKDGWLVTGDLAYVDDEGYIFLTGRKKNLIITKNGENVSPEEIENKLGENRLVSEILVRESEGFIEAEIFPDMEYAQKKKIKDIPTVLQEIIDKYNKTVPPYKKVYRLKVRETEFEKTQTKKIKRF
ncbi:MAG: AMP-binding protein [Ruminococcus sp.]